MGKNSERLRERKAYHEAGHVVTFILLMLPFESVSLREKREDKFDIKNGEKVPVTHTYTEGIVWSEEKTKSLNEEVIRGKLDLREAIASVAGPEAEKIFIGGIDDEAQFGAKSDMQAIIVPCRAAISQGLPIENWKVSVMEAPIFNALAKEANILLEENWKCVVAVADALIKYRSLTFDESVNIINRTKGS
ncbi:MAG TPA: hypothetical protein PK528_13985 [Syntrophorhabdus sp.]|jgi:hypothetical protein|nr:hypothetical protein [Syntrophorhabdus sp.]